MDESVRLRAAEVADRLLGKLDGSRAVVVATEDGFELGCATRSSLESARLAAIMSSLSAIGEVMAAEAGIGRVRCLMLEGESGYIVVRGGGRIGTVGVVVAALVTREALLGLAMHAVAETVRELSA
ncbi:roadblock/LC7 domain-containing protein [Ideonella sp. YS5]|uniref:roadblock/LC7 domain-containing protein n=1 Tax=Ideonella sp. YS5 TaxID=3453714 RepID=UPI003EEF5C04